MRGPRRPSGWGEIARQVNWLLFAGFIAVLAIALYACKFDPYVGVSTFIFVLVGWLFSLTLHEFSHAATAFLAGDRSSSTRQYLTGNPLKYLHPILSIVLPLLFVLIGGFGLPGGAVYLQRGLIRGRWRQSAVSLAGPAANLIVLLVLAALYQLNLFVHFLSVGAVGALAFLAFLQATAILLNLLPIPGLDGYGAIEPYLSYELRQNVEFIRPYGFMLIFLLFYIPTFQVIFFGLVYRVVSLAGVGPEFIGLGYSLFHFWQR